MTVGEDKNKVVNLVRPLLPQFRALYSKEVNKMSEFLWYRSNTNEFEQDVGLAGRHFHLSMLPKKMQEHLVRVNFWKL
jgi:Phosphatidate cytidylyltransferase, mitochondrial